MLKIDKRCKVCTLVKKDGKFLQRIYDSKEFVKGGESLRAISRDFEGVFEYQSLYNHVKKHQGLSPEDLENKVAVKKAREIEAKQLRETIKHTEARNELLAIGMDGIREGEIKLKGADVVGLLKQTADIEAKDKDRELDIARMIQEFASGERREVIDIDAE